MARFFLPAEAGDRGVTLWIVPLWWLAAAARCWWLFRQGSREEGGIGSGTKGNRCSLSRIPGSLLEWGVFALVGGHLLSGTLVLLGEGDRRAALNLMWEWSSVGVLYVLLRERLRRPQVRLLVSRTFLVSVLALSCLGIWQHFVWYPRQSANVGELLAYQQRIELGERLETAERRRYDELVGQVGTDLLTLDETGRRMLLARIQESLEPIGRFALTNTLAALLAVGLILLLDQALPSVRAGGPPPRWGLGLCAGLVGFCLLLTKSRTAWIAALCGLLAFGLLRGIRWHRERAREREIATPHPAPSPGETGTGRTSPSLRPVILRGGLFVCATVAAALVLGAVAWKLGGIDAEAFSEAPKSVQYRLEYWHSTVQLLRESPLFGVGPGNFRQHYLRYKLPGSSEEILDPHNLFLDVWANGGLPALAGLLLLLVALGRSAVACLSPFGQSGGGEGGRNRGNGDGAARVGSVLTVGVVALGLVLLVDWMLTGGADGILLGTAGAWCGFAVLSRFLPARSITPVAAVAAALALLVHFLGAGGIGMPAMTQLLLVCLLLSSPSLPLTKSISKPGRGGVPLPLIGGVLSLAAVFACLATALVPVVSASVLVETGQHLMVLRGQTRQAQSAFEQATQADPLAAEPWQQRAMLLWVRWQTGGGRDESLFDEAVVSQQEAIARDPYGSGRYRTLAEWWMRRYESTRRTEDAKAAISAFREALARYPQHAPLRAGLALALAAAGEPAAQEAAYALELDRLNLEREHFDKLLSDQLRDRLEELEQGGEEPGFSDRRQEK